jgi:hypothetical protein
MKVLIWNIKTGFMKDFRTISDHVNYILKRSIYTSQVPGSTPNKIVGYPTIPHFKKMLRF